MSENDKNPQTTFDPAPQHHAHLNGRRCCGRLLSEKCSPEEEAAKINAVTGEKSCCKGNHGKS